VWSPARRLTWCGGVQVEQKVESLKREKEEADAPTFKPTLQTANKHSPAVGRHHPISPPPSRQPHALCRLGVEGRPTLWPASRGSLTIVRLTIGVVAAGARASRWRERVRLPGADGHGEG
jgi:hypothetical protein